MERTLARLLPELWSESNPTVEDGGGPVSHVETESETCEAAKAAAGTQIPEGSKASSSARHERRNGAG